MPRQMGYIHCNYWLHQELSKIYEQLNSLSSNNRPSLFCSKLPLELPKIVSQMDAAVISLIWFCYSVVKNILGYQLHMYSASFKEFTRIRSDYTDCGIRPNLPGPWRSCGTKQWTSTKYNTPVCFFALWTLGKQATWKRYFTSRILTGREGWCLSSLVD